MKTIPRLPCLGLVMLFALTFPVISRAASIGKDRIGLRLDGLRHPFDQLQGCGVKYVKWAGIDILIPFEFKTQLDARALRAAKKVARNILLLRTNHLFPSGKILKW
jgi:hypothetical protein